MGVHSGIRDAKTTELSRVRELIRDRRAGRPPETLADWTVADLVAYEGRIESVKTWLFTPSTLLRFGFYVALGLSSWLGAALVERALAAALG
jgi:uncharacterized membrane protein